MPASEPRPPRTRSPQAARASAPGRLPYRGRFGAVRPAGLPVLPPAPMPSHRGLNPIKSWRWVGLFGPEVMLCAAQVRVGPARQAFWALHDRHDPQPGLLGASGRPRVSLATGRVRIEDAGVELDLTFSEGDGVETVSAARGDYAWTRKQAGLLGAGALTLSGVTRTISGAVIVDDSCGYLPRHTAWRWCAGVGRASGGEHLAWNLVEGVHDAARGSERTLWVDGAPRELPPTHIALDLSAAGELAFRAEVTREANENRLIVRSRYRQPFGTFSGAIGGYELIEGYGVMEEHDAHW